MHEPTAARPLEGIRVLSLAFNIPGPVAAARLGALGAAVTKVEPPTGDPLARASPAWYRRLIEGQRVVALDLKQKAGRAEFDAMLAAADLLLTSMRPAALERLALVPSLLRERHPRLCHTAVVGYGGPDRDRAGHDLTYQAAAGLVRPPELPLTLVADMAATERIVSTALAQLVARERQGGGSYAEVAISEAVDAFRDPLRFGLTGPGTTLGGALSVYRLYAAADGWVALAALEPHFLGRLLEELGLDSIDPAGFEAVFRTRTADEWDRWARERDLPLAAVRAAAAEG
jgi:alpha-methylacyl-CoA racemase